MAYDARAIANYFLDKSEKDNKSLSPMKLLKLVYFAHGWHLAIFDKPLIDETIEAWKYGPVISSLYHEFKSFGNDPIQTKAIDFDLSRGELVEVKANLDTNARDLLNRIWEIYSDFTAIQLSNITHQSGTPWDRIWNKEEGNQVKGKDIPDQYIKEYFLAQANS